MELKLVHYSTNDDPTLLKGVWDRINLFCEKYESESDRRVLFEEVARNYFSPSPSMLLFAAIDEGNIVGHAVCTLENFYGSTSINMLQYWKDPGIRIPDKIKAAVFSKLVEWGKSVGTDKMRIWARNEQVAQHFEKYGFTRDPKIIMNASLTEVANRLSELPRTPEEEKE